MCSPTREESCFKSTLAKLVVEDTDAKADSLIAQCSRIAVTRGYKLEDVYGIALRMFCFGYTVDELMHLLSTDFDKVLLILHTRFMFHKKI